jgi:hypothetical protein
VAGIDTGTTVAVGIQRGSENVTLTAQIIEQPVDGVAKGEGQASAPSTGAAADATGGGLLAGVHVMEIPPAHEQILPPHAHGVMVASVDDNCPASGALQPSDVIEEIDHFPIHSVSEYQQAAGEVGGQEVLLSICRDRRRSFTVVTAQ